MFIEVPDEATIGPEAAEWYERQRASWGYLPNYAPAFALRPDVAAAWNGLNGAIIGGMDRRRFELATIAAARALRSTYCMAAHCTFMRDICGDEETMRAVAADPTGAQLDAADRAVLHLASQVARDATSVTAEDVQPLRDAGLDDTDIVNVVLAAAARSFFTKVLDGLGVQADAQLGDSLGPDVREQVVVGRPMAD